MTSDDVFCCEAGCHLPATTERFIGVIPHAPDINGIPDPDGFSWLVELVCANHTDGES